MNTNRPVRYILFDIGVVLVTLDYARALKRIEPFFPAGMRGKGQTFFNLMGRDPKLAEYERGELATSAFFDHFRDRTGFTGTLEQFTDIWCDIFAENRPMLDFGRELAERYPCISCPTPARCMCRRCMKKCRA
jgi:hypothetical protein